MENSRIAGAKRRLAIAKRFTAGAAAVAFGVTFVAIRGGTATSGTAASTVKTSTAAAKQVQTTTQTRTTTKSQPSFFGNSNVGSSSGAAPSVSSSTS